MVSMRACGGTVQQVHSQDSAWSWFVCLSATFADGLSLSLSNCFAIMLPVLIQEFNETRENAAWVGSIAYSMSYFCAPLSAWCCVRFGCRRTAIVGTLTCAVSLIISSFAPGLLMMYFIYGALFGIGGGFIHTSGLLTTTKYFYKRRSLATGIVAAGASIGTLIGPVYQALIDGVGWRNSYRIIGALFSIACILVWVSYDPKVKDGQEDRTVSCEQGSQRRSGSCACPSLDCAVWRIPEYTVVLIAATVEAVGVYVPLAHLVKHCREIGVSAQKSSTLFIYIGITSFAGKLVSGRLCDSPRISTLYVHQISALIIGASVLMIRLASDYTGFAIFAACYGCGNGMFITTMYLLFLNTVEPRLRPSALAYGEMVNAVSIAIGSPIAGLLADKMGSYIVSFYFSGGIVLFGASIPLLLCFRRKKNVVSDRELIEFKQGLKDADFIERETVL
ncbi:predicted protein [Nematostella vectensis]|uniref:Major facilitator superfamily (MFS) profile domain-containing protein n=1 Tax=Nematostella vectensis TaxID=45351 RepID=A7RJ37_NEMVE|nr:predicted protein [Nematostella vectensis]|eukprot:XP_001640678.1 predicted protein [Nematostella vectensis]